MWHKFLAGESLAVGTHYTRHIVLHDWMTLHALQYTVSGSGKLTIEVETSIGGESWVSNGVVVRSAVSTSGPGGNGSDIIPLKLKIGDLLRLKLIVATDAITLTLWFTQK